MHEQARVGRWWAVAAAGVLVLGLAACSETPEGVDGDLTGQWSRFPEASSFLPQADVCHQGAYRPQVTVEQYQPIDCGQPHLVETVHIGEFTDEAAEQEEPPGEGSSPRRTAFRECEEQAADHLGADYRRGRLWLGVAAPTPEAWQGGARWFRCDMSELERVAGEPVPREGSLSGALAEDGAPLRLGCYHELDVDDNDVVQGRTPIACDEPHRAEFAGLWRADGGDYPDADDADVVEEVQDGCRSTIAEFTDVPDDDDVRFRVGTIADWMSERDWDAGDRAFRCYLLLDEDVDESLEGAGTDALPVRTE